MKRRTFLSLLGAGTCSFATPALAAEKKFKTNPDSFGVLHDTSLCIGCRKCEQACSSYNKLPVPDLAEDIIETPRRTSAYAWTVVNKYQVQNQSIFRKQQCNHCNEPACASACFVKALKKEADGAVSYDPSLCVGCRYCMVACPFNVPGYQYDKALNPLVQKCTLCRPRILQGLQPACVESCPKEALLFGKRSELILAARKKLASNSDYIQQIYGEYEMGGTAWLYLAKNKFSQLGLDENLGTKTAYEYTSGALGSVPMIVGLWPVLLGGAYAISKRRDQVADQEQEQAVAKAVEQTQNSAEQKLKKALEKADADKNKAVATETKALQSELENTKAEAEQAKAESEKLKTDTEEAKTAAEKAKAGVEEAIIKAKTLEEQAKAAATALEQSQAKLAAEQNSASTAQSEAQNLKAKTQSLEAELETAKSEAAKAKQEAEAAQAELAALKLAKPPVSSGTKSANKAKKIENKHKKGGGA